MSTCHINIKVIPKSSKNEIGDWENEELKIRLKAVPEKGEANEVLIKFLSKQLNVPQSSIEIVTGSKSRHKRLRIGMSQDEVLKKLAEGNKKK